jgi:hypothetical protein
MKLDTKSYYRPTPTKWRKLGDSILILGTTLTATFAGMEVDKGWIIAAAIVTAVGKMVTNFFSEDEGAMITETTEVKYPATMAANVEVTKETKIE